MREGRRDPLAPNVAALIEKRFDEEASRVAEHRDERRKNRTRTPAIRSRCWPKSIWTWSPGAVSTRTVAREAVYKNRALALADVADYIDRFYNRTRRHGHLGGVSPEQFEAAHKPQRKGLH